MKILVVTQKIDKEDGYFGFFHEWLSEFARAFDSVVAIGLEVGPHDLPRNVKVLSLGKERKRSRMLYILKLLWFSFRERSEYDAVFVHMNPPYLIVAGWLWKLLGKKVGLWYVHKQVDFKLKVAHKMADIVFTAVLESFRIPSNKVVYLGQAVPLDAYRRPDTFVAPSHHLRIVTVGRITPIKNLDALVRAAGLLKEKGVKFSISIIGKPVTDSDRVYKSKLDHLVEKANLSAEVSFMGEVPNKDMPKYYWESDLSINLAPTGGLDKAVLESMAARTPVIVANQAFASYYGEYASRLLVTETDPRDIAAKIEGYAVSADREVIAARLYKEVSQRSSLRWLIGRIASILQANETGR